jgi:hypothetical protein
MSDDDAVRRLPDAELISSERQQRDARRSLRTDGILDVFERKAHGGAGHGICPAAGSAIRVEVAARIASIPSRSRVLAMRVSRSRNARSSTLSELRRSRSHGIIKRPIPMSGRRSSRSPRGLSAMGCQGALIHRSLQPSRRPARAYLSFLVPSGRRPAPWSPAGIPTEDLRRERPETPCWLAAGGDDQGDQMQWQVRRCTAR